MISIPQYVNGNYNNLLVRGFMPDTGNSQELCCLTGLKDILGKQSTIFGRLVHPWAGKTFRLETHDKRLAVNFCCFLSVDGGCEIVEQTSSGNK